MFCTMPAEMPKFIDGAERREASATKPTRRSMLTGGLMATLIRLRGVPVLGALARAALRLIWRMEIPPSVTIGEGTIFLHGNSTFIHPNVRIGRHCVIAHLVTIGLQDVWDTGGEATTPVVLEDHVMLSPGAKVLAPPEGLTVGRGTLVAANAALGQSTGEWEIWGGVPARKVADRTPPPTFAKNFPGEGPGEPGRP
jgi:serine O-acetyltransferase